MVVLKEILTLSKGRESPLKREDRKGTALSIISSPPLNWHLIIMESPLKGTPLESLSQLNSVT